MEAFRDDADDHMSITSKILAHSSLATQVAVAAALEAIQGNEDASSSLLRGRRRRARRNNEGKNETDQNMRVMRRKLTTEQLNYLEMSFGTERKLESQRKNKLASELGLDPRQVAVWFQNRRARWKSKRLEEEYSKLKAAHEGVSTEKYQLEAEVLKLQEQLAQVEKERLKLEERVERMSSSSPKEVGWSTLLGELAPLGRHENIFDLCEINYIHEIEWGNLCKYGL